MPEITETTPRETYTIDGETYSIPAPYKTGDVLTAGEASQLNQVYAENIRNNMAAKSKAQKESDPPTWNHDIFQGTIDDYCETYEMGVRTGGGRSGDPVMVEAMEMSRKLVREAIQKQGHKLADVPAKRISELAKGILDSGKYPQIMETAKAKVAAAAGLGAIELNLTPAAEAPAAEEPSEASHSKGRKHAE